MSLSSLALSAIGRLTKAVAENRPKDVFSEICKMKVCVSKSRLAIISCLHQDLQLDAKTLEDTGIYKRIRAITKPLQQFAVDAEVKRNL